MTGADVLEPSLGTVPNAAAASGLRNSRQVKATDGGADVAIVSAGELPVPGRLRSQQRQHLADRHQDRERRRRLTAAGTPDYVGSVSVQGG
jgi:hypothetical protein